MSKSNIFTAFFLTVSIFVIGCYCGFRFREPKEQHLAKPSIYVCYYDKDGLAKEWELQDEIWNMAGTFIILPHDDAMWISTEKE